MPKNDLPAWYKGELHDCDRCGQRYPKLEMQYQGGLLLCRHCFDDLSPVHD